MNNKVEEILKKTNAFMKGHFLLSSGLHSDTYVQCAKALLFPKYANYIANEIFKITSYLRPNIVVSPALGGIIIGWEVARVFDIPFMFCERENGVMTMRRGFEIEKEKKVLIVEDVFTTGKSTIETAEVIRSYGAEIIGAASIVKRGDINFRFPYHFLLEVKLLSYEPKDCPLCKEGVPLVKPGSRFIR